MTSLVFQKILSMSYTASLVILAVLLLRVILWKAPKIFSYALWAVVLFRLLCPFSIYMPFSLISANGNGILDVQRAESEITLPYFIDENEVVHQNTEQNQETEIYFDHDNYLNPAIDLTGILSIIWMIGMLCMTAYSVYSYLKMKCRLIGSVAYDSEGKIYFSDYIDTPFVIGIIRPKIYLPSFLEKGELDYILLHEQNHIKRGDHIWKALGYFALILHWFNPLVWFGFIESTKDMEMSLDEKVLSQSREKIKQEYSSSLLKISTGNRKILFVPPAFGEGDTKSRIRNILNFHKPKKHIIIGAFLISFIAALCLMTDRTRATDTDRIEVLKPVIIQTFEKTNLTEDHDVYEEWVKDTYYKMSDGTWRAELNQTNNITKEYSYQYRLVFHDTMPNAAVASNYIVLSNSKNITFRQVWMAFGFSSNTEDYFKPDDAVIISSWLGELDHVHPERDEDTIYYIAEDE